MKTLVVTYRPIAMKRNGYDLRVANLCRQIDGQKHLVIVPLLAPETRPADIDMTKVFDSVETLDVDLRQPLDWRRHLRLSEVHYLQRSMPRTFLAGVSRLQALLEHTGATHVVAFGSNLAELVRASGARHVLLDVCDSSSLTVRRQLALNTRSVGWRQRLGERVHLLRWAPLEGGLPRWFGQITTINDADTREVVRLHGAGAGNVHTIPNGVGERFLAPLADPRTCRSVAFWGNLTFLPNAEALRHFVHAIYQPHLRSRDVRLRVIGDGAPAWLLEAARHDSQIEVLGLVDDLAAAVLPCPVMVNPMLIGSGMKNKVLEAFGLGLVVVSTPLGIESIPQAVSGEHHLVADTPPRFADSILRLLDDEPLRQRLRSQANALLHQHYRWDIIGRRWRDLIAAC